MPYRRTERVEQRLADRRAAIVRAAMAIAAEGGLAAVQVAPVARRAGVAAGTVYQYFTGKDALVAAVTDEVCAAELAAMREAAAGAPGPLSALAASVATFALRQAAHKRLAWAVFAEVQDGAGGAPHREALAAEIAAVLAPLGEANRAAALELPLTARALAGALIDAACATRAEPDAELADADAARALAALALRSVGVPDAQARGLAVGVRLADAEAPAEDAS